MIRLTIAVSVLLLALITFTTGAAMAAQDEGFNQLKEEYQQLSAYLGAKTTY